jgi:hypothetical protein
MVYRPAYPLLLALLGLTRVAAAQDDSVRVTCPALAPDAAAQVEARTRATLLTSVSGNLKVHIECGAETAVVRVIVGERSESTLVTLPPERPEDALLAAVEHALDALEHETEGASAEFAPPPERRATATAPAVAPPSPTQPAPLPSRRPPPPEAARWDLGGAALAELWSGRVGYGARLMLEREQSAWSFGAAFGELVTPAIPNGFRAHEVHAFAFGAFEERTTTGLRAALGIGASVLVVEPNAELIARSSTTASSAFFSVELGRPVRFGRAWLLPALAARIFPAGRDVNVDATRRLELPRVCPSLSVAFGYAI